MSSRHNLLYIINSLKTGGAEIGMCRLLNGLDKTKYDVTVVSLDGYETAIKNKLPSWASFVDLQLPSLPYRIARLIPLARNADTIVGSLFHSVLIARAVGTLNKNATVATWQHNSRFKNERRKQLYGLTNRFTDVFLADSEPVAEFLANEFEISTENIQIVPIAGIQPERYSVVDHNGTQNLTIGTVGRLTKEKNYSTLLDVASKFSEDGLTFEIAGDGELHDELLEEKRARGLSNVAFHGTVHDIPEFLSTVDIYFQPSLYEGLCITVLEAMAVGLPVVGSDVGGISRNVVHNKSGFLYEPNDIEGYCSGIRELAANPELRTEFGKRSRRIVAKNFTQEVLVSEFENAVRCN